MAAFGPVAICAQHSLTFPAPLAARTQPRASEQVSKRLLRTWHCRSAPEEVCDGKEGWDDGTTEIKYYQLDPVGCDESQRASQDGSDA